MSDRQPHTTDALDPMVAEELRRLEAALAGAPSADPQLLALVDAVRADAEPPRPQFRRDLDARATAGFPADGAPRAWVAAARGRLSSIPLAPGPALGLAAAMLVALVVGVGVLRDAGPGGGTGITSYTSSEARNGEQVPEAARAPGASTDSAAGGAAPSSAISPPSPPSTGPTTPTPSFGRKVQQATQLALTTSPDDLQQVADGVVRVTQAAGGVVEQSTVDATPDGGGASFALSVPTAKAQATVKELSALASVASTSQSSTDITGSFVSAVDRLSDARAERRALLKALDAARTPEGIARLRERVRVNRAEIARLNAELRGLRDRADNTSILVSLTADPSSASEEDTGAGAWTPSDAAGDALRVLEVAAGVLLVALAVALPLALLGVPALLGARVARRRRREGALGPA